MDRPIIITSKRNENKKTKKKNSRKTTGGVEGIYFPATHFPPFKLWFNLADVHKTCVCVCNPSMPASTRPDGKIFFDFFQEKRISRK